MKIIKLILQNFKGIKSLIINANGSNVDIYGDNGTGKTTIMDAVLWLLFGKDSENRSNFNIKTLDQNGEPLHNLEHEVECSFDVNGKTLVLKKSFKEQWTKKRGSNNETFTGHTTTYFINEVPVKESEYNDKIKSLASEEAFKLLTNPSYFNEQLHWKERRKILLQVCGDVSNNEVISNNPELKAISKCVIDGERTIEQHKTVLQSNMKKINDRIKEIPVRISEVDKGLPDVTGIDFNNIPDRISFLNEEIQDNQRKLAGLGNSTALVEKQNKLLELDGELIRIANDYNAKRQTALKELRSECNKIDEEYHESMVMLNRCKDKIDDKKAAIERLNNSVVSLRNEFQEISKQQYGGSDICPTCGQTLPNDKIEYAKKSFNLNKTERLEEINSEGKKISNEVKATNSLLSDLQSEHEKLITTTNELKTKLNEINSKYDSYMSNPEKDSANLTLIPEYKAILAQKAQVESEIKNLQEGSQDDAEPIKNKISELTSKVQELQAALAKKEQVETAAKRKAELSAEEKKLAGEYEQLEQEMFLTEEFIKMKVSLLDGKINSFFKYAKFKMFTQQVNGGIDETCETTFNGVPYSDLNNAMKINIGIDIINTLSQYHGFYAPIFVDNAESVTRLAEVNTQVFRLIVSEPDKKLRMDILGEAMKEAV